MASSTAGRREWTALAVLCLPLLLVSMDVSVLFFAVPSIAAALEPTATQLLWIFDIYGFVLAGLLLTMGNVADRIGRRRLLLLGAVAFGAASVLAAYAPNAEWLILARALLGVGGSTLMPSTLALSSATSSLIPLSAPRRSESGRPSWPAASDWARSSRESSSSTTGGALSSSSTCRSCCSCS